MRLSFLVLVCFIAAACEGPREWALPYDGSAFPTNPADGPARNTDPENPLTPTAGSSGGSAGVGGGGAGGGNSGGGGSGGGSPAALDAGNHPIDAEQPAGGCDPMSSPKACVGDVLRVCEASGTVVNTSCAHGCDAVRLDCHRCRPNARTCDGSNLVVCNAEGTATTMMACTSGCDPASNECRACEPGAVWCAGDTLRECTPAGEPRDRQACSEGCDMARKACNACRPGTKTCNGNALQTCRPDGTGTTSENCGSGCNSARLACNTCEPGTKMCSGNTLRTCRSDGSGWLDQACPNGCSAERCNTCNPSGGRSCDGTSVRQCRGDGSGFDLTPCARGCAGGNCCGGNTEASGGSCRACGGNNQPCCEIASPRCTGTLACQGDRCVVPCGAADGQCPAGCNFQRDRDCEKPNGEACNGDDECQNGNCSNSVCCGGNQHGCGNGRCAANNDVNACGPSCTRCPTRLGANVRCENNRCVYSCMNDHVEVNGECFPCGGTDQRCCANFRCGPGRTCEDVRDTPFPSCQPCGGLSRICCVKGERPCQSAEHVCTDAGGAVTEPPPHPGFCLPPGAAEPPRSPQ